MSLLLVVCGVDSVSAAAPHRSAREPLLRLVQAGPATGTFFSMQLDLPPFPFNPFPGFDLYAFKSSPGTFYVDDQTVDYSTLKSLPGLGVAYDLAVPSGFTAAEAAQLSATSGGRRFLRLMSDPPTPGGGGSGGPVPPPSQTPLAGLKFTNTVRSGSSITTHLREANPNWAYDLYFATNLISPAWIRVVEGGIGQLDFTLVPPAGTMGFWMAGDGGDPDMDGLTTSFELLHGLNPNSRDSDGDGIWDGEELSPDGIPWWREHSRAFAVTVEATAPTATEGGSNGQFVLRLPRPAPAGGLVVSFHLGGTAVRAQEYGLAPNVNAVLFPAGQSNGVITVAAVDDAAFAEIERTVELRLTNAVAGGVSWPVDGQPAVVQLVDNDLPALRVFALPAEAAEPVGTNVQNGGFLVVREGPATGALGVSLGVSGTAANGVDYGGIPGTITIPAGSRSVLVPMAPVSDNVVEGTETVLLSLTGAAGHVVDPLFAKATNWITDASLPVVQVFAQTAFVVENAAMAPWFRITRTGATGTPLTVRLRVDGTAEAGVDYLALAPLSGTNTVGLFSVTIPAGAATAWLNGTPIDDGLSEPAETVRLTLAAGDYQIGPGNSASLWIDDNEPTVWSAERTRAAAAAGPAIDVPGEIEFRRLGTAQGQAVFALAGLAEGDAVNAFPAWTSGGLPPLSGDVAALSGGGIGVVFAPGRSVARVGVHQLPPGSSSVWASQSTPLSRVHLWTPAQPAFGSNAVAMLAQSRVVGLATAVDTGLEGSTAQRVVFQLVRPYPPPQGGPWDPYVPENPPPVLLRVGGSASPGSDHVWPAAPALTAGSYFTAFNFPVFAPADAAVEGWETIVAAIDPKQSAWAVLPSAPMSGAWIRDGDTNGFLRPPMDVDRDGLTDDYEITHGLDRFAATDTGLDRDRDGQSELEEQTGGTSPTVAAPPPLRDPSGALLAAHQAETVLVRARLCTRCHTAEPLAPSLLQIGGATLVRSPAERERFTETILALARGSSYPVKLHVPGHEGFYQAEIAPVNPADAVIIEDPAGLLGFHAITATASPGTALVHVPDLQLAVDANRDGAIRFRPDAADLTTITNPHTFWINDDADAGSGDTAVDLDPLLNQRNYANNFIDGLRDLEDLTRLHLRLAGVPGTAFSNGTYQVWLELQPTTGTPSVRLFQAYELDGGTGYLTSESIAAAQTVAFGNGLGLVTSSTALQLPPSFWSGASPIGWKSHLLFEGVGLGSGTLKLTLRSNTTVLASSPLLHLNLRKVTDLFEHWTVGDTNTTEWNQIPFEAARTTDSPIFGPPTRPEEQDYLLFVHGWRMQPWERRAFAATAYKRLWHSGYKGRFGLFSWPTDWTETDKWDMRLTVNRQNYDRSERRGWHSARRLRRLLVQLDETYPGRVGLFAHSMGNIVASEALLQQSRLASTPVVRAYVASQAASVAHAYDAVGPRVVHNSYVPEVYAAFPAGNGTAPYFTGMRNAVQVDPLTFQQRIINYHNSIDYALSDTYTWPFNQKTKPDYGWDYAPSLQWHRTTQVPPIRLRLPRDAYEIFAHLAPARSQALGAAEYSTNGVSSTVRGEIGGDVNLRGLPFDYRDGEFDHSAQFNSTIQRRLPYWQQLRQTLFGNP